MRRWPIMRALLLFFALAMGGASCTYVLHALHAPKQLNVIVDAQLYFLLFVPLAYFTDKRVFSRELWTVSRAIFASVPTAAVIQLCIQSIGPPLQASDRYEAFAAIFLAPFVEELIRAVMMLAFAEKLGLAFNIALTGVLTATAHEFFWIALVMQTVLCIIFWKSHRSLPTVMASHLAINLIAVFQVRFQSFM